MPPDPSREKYMKRLVSREYKEYQEEEFQTSLPRTVYEKSCNSAVKFLKVNPDAKTRKKLQDAIDFAHLKTTPEGVMSLTVTFLFLSIFVSVFPMVLLLVGLPGLDIGYGALILTVALFFTLYLYVFPYHLKKKYENAAGADIVMMILYVVMYMRNTPSLEGAVRFAAGNIGGSLGYEMKKLLWDVELGNYLSMEEALLDYSKKWHKNRPYVEAVQLILTSTRQPGPRREQLLEESIGRILEGNREQAKEFNQRLKLPVTLVHALGIILPVMGLVMFPIVAVFLGVDASILFVGYDILLPMILYFVITSVMELRPATFSKIDITDNPDAPPKGKFRLAGSYVKAWPVATIVGASVVLMGMAFYMIELRELGPDFEGIIPAVVITGGIALGVALYYILVSSPFLKIREKTRNIEGEFAEALYQLGNQVSGGTPIELSIEHSMERIKDMSIHDLFAKSLKNMKLLGMTFYQSFFDEKYGAVNYYPSRMIKSVMKTVVESSKKGVKVAANAMVSISGYLKGLHETQEEVKDNLSDTLNSLKFQALFLTPLISGVIGTLAIIIIRVLRNLSVQSGNIGGPEGVPLLSSFGDIAITPFQFIMIVSVYMIETSFILGMFINSIENGEDNIGRQNVTGYIMLIGTFVFILSLLVTLMIFSPLITAVGV